MMMGLRQSLMHPGLIAAFLEKYRIAFNIPRWTHRQTSIRRGAADFLDEMRNGTVNLGKYQIRGTSD